MLCICVQVARMAPKRNGMVPNAHFRKHWQRRVRTWFDQPGKKKTRRVKRLKKAAEIAPRPAAGLLRPVVHCPTFKYNSRIRAGKGFTLEELKVRPVAKSLEIRVCYVGFSCNSSTVHAGRWDWLQASSSYWYSSGPQEKEQVTGGVSDKCTAAEGVSF